MHLCFSSGLARQAKVVRRRDAMRDGRIPHLTRMRASSHPHPVWAHGFLCLGPQKNPGHLGIPLNHEEPKLCIVARALHADLGGIEFVEPDGEDGLCFEELRADEEHNADKNQFAGDLAEIVALVPSMLRKAAT